MAIQFLKKARNTGEVSCVRFCIDNGGVYRGERKKIGRFGVTKKVGKKLSKTNYVEIGIDTDRKRIYFRAGDKSNGYKMFDANTRFDIKFTLPTDIEPWQQFVGDHVLRFDDEERMYYIEAGGSGK